MSTYVFDSNPFYYLSNLYTSDQNRYDRIASVFRKKKTIIVYTPISVIELVSKIRNHPEEFNNIKQGVKCVLELGGKSLADFEQKMWEIVCDSRKSPKEYDYWNEVFITIANATDYNSLVKGFDDYKTVTRRAVYADFLATFRQQYEDNYVNDMLTAIRAINPRYDKMIRKGKSTRLPKSEHIAFDKFIQTIEWRMTVLSIIQYRSKSKLPTRKDELRIVEDKIKYYKAGYEFLMAKIVKEGYSPIPHKNDYNDIHLLLYINDYSSNIIVSDDHLIKNIPIVKGKVITFDYFVSKVLNCP